MNVSAKINVFTLGTSMGRRLVASTLYSWRRAQRMQISIRPFLLRCSRPRAQRMENGNRWKNKLLWISHWRSMHLHCLGCAGKVSESVQNCATVLRFWFVVRCSRGRAQRMEKRAEDFACACAICFTRRNSIWIECFSWIQYFHMSNPDLIQMSQLKSTFVHVEHRFGTDVSSKINVFVFGNSIWLECLN